MKYIAAFFCLVTFIGGAVMTLPQTVAYHEFGTFLVAAGSVITIVTGAIAAAVWSADQ